MVGGREADWGMIAKNPGTRVAGDPGRAVAAAPVAGARAGFESVRG